MSKAPAKAGKGDHHDHDHGHHHHDHAPSAIHDVTVTSVSLRGGEMNPDRFFPWIQKVTQTQGPNILRLKGIIAFKGDEERYVVQGVHMIVEGDHQRPWKDGEKREFKPRDGGFKGKPASGRSGDFKPRRPGGRAR